MLQNKLISGVDVTGHQHLCQMYGKTEDTIGQETQEFSIEGIDKKLQCGELSTEDTESLKEMIQKLKNGEFFELLTMEFSGKIKEVAKELINFRKDLQERIEPDIVELAARDIPEASNQLEGINETLEESTMRIMDINEEQMEIANKQAKLLGTFLSSNGNGKNKKVDIPLADALDMIDSQISIFKDIGNLSFNMMEPLSFQDLVGQRIQKIIKLVRSMEVKIEELIVSFGIKLQKHKEDPERTYEDLNQDVNEYLSDLKGPQREGEGLDQSSIDDLLANL